MFRNLLKGKGIVSLALDQDGSPPAVFEPALEYVERGRSPGPSGLVEQRGPRQALECSLHKLRKEVPIASPSRSFAGVPNLQSNVVSWWKVGYFANGVISGFDRKSGGGDD
jgi:hypothetical protein